MPRIDPLQLLTCLNVLLAKNGGVLSHAEVERLAKLMGRYSKKLVSKCIYIQILKCTKTDLLGEFMRVGGWSLTHTWLTDGIRGKNWPLVQEILELLLLCPVDVQRLKSNSAPKLVKQLSKDGGNEGVRIYATRLVEQWLNVVKSETKMTTNEETNLISSIAMTPPTVTSTITSTLSQDITKSTNSDILNNSPSNSSSSAAAQMIVNNLLSPSTKEQQPQRKLSTDSAIMYKIIVKDGKQILSKIENSPNSSTATKDINTTSSVDAPLLTEKIDFVDCGTIKNSDEIDLKPEDIISNKENDKKNIEKDNKDLKQKTKINNNSSSSSSSSKDKHKSSSSHRSSSKSSSSKTSSSSSSKSKSSSSHHRNSTDSTRSRDSGKDKERSDKHKSSSSKSTSSSSKDKHREKSKDKEKEKSDQAEKDKETLSKILPPTLDKIGKIPKKLNKDDTTINGSTAKPIVNQSITIPSKKASMSIEIRKDTDKAKTVKTYKSQFRSHGLTEEAPPPPSRKNLKKPSSLSLPGTSIPNTTTSAILSNCLSLKRSSPPPTSILMSSTNPTEPIEPKDLLPPSDKKLKIDLTSLPTNIIEKPGAIKLIAPKPKPASLVESDMFMDALFASAVTKKDIRKRKRRTSGSKEPASPSDSPVTVKATPLKFYQDTLEEKDENNKSDVSAESNKDIKDKDNNKNDSSDAIVDDEDDDIPLKKVKEDIEEKCRQQEKDEKDDRSQDNSGDDDQDIYEQIKKLPGPGCGPDGPPGVLMLHRRRGPKKKLKWRPQEQLEDIRFFELDETERVNVTKTFTDMKQMERCNERETFLMARKVGSEDLMVEQTPWMPLILCDDVPTHPDGSQSKEKKIQCEREQTTLKALYFSRAMIPDSASEPDMEHYQITEAAVIPLDDITGNPDAVNDYMKYGWPEPKGSPPRNLDDNTNLGIGGISGRGGLNDNDMKFPNNQFNPFLSFGGNNNNNIGQQNNGPWSMGGGPNIGPPNGMQNGGPGIIPPNLMAGPINNPFQMSGNVMPPNIMMNMNGGGPHMSPPDIQNNLIPPFGQVGPNFGPPNGMMNGPVGPMVTPLMGNNNFGGPPMNMNGMPNMNMNSGPMRGMNNRNNGGGNWRSGGQSNNNINNNGGGGNNWRGGGGGGGNQRNWVHGNSGRGICKSFMRGFCRNGNKCNYIHPGPNNNNNRI